MWYWQISYFKTIIVDSFFHLSSAYSEYELLRVFYYEFLVACNFYLDFASIYQIFNSCFIFLQWYTVFLFLITSNTWRIQLSDVQGKSSFFNVIIQGLVVFPDTGNIVGYTTDVNIIERRGNYCADCFSLIF